MRGPAQDSSSSSNFDEMDDTSLNESPVKMESEPEVEPPVADECSIQELKEKRELIQHLLANASVAEGDYWFVIPQSYLENFFDKPVDTFKELKSYLGPVNTNLILDSNGMLYPEDKEPTLSTSVSRDVFKHLIEWFGIDGDPVSRALLIDQHGNKSIERFPPYFVLHTLSKTVPKNAYNTNSRPTGIFVSQTRSFENVMETIRTSYFKNSKASEFRLWFIDSERIEDVPANITINSFVNDITVKTIVFKGIYNYSLKSQKISGPRYHLLIEPYEKASKQYLLNSYLEGLDSTSFEGEQLLKTGGDIGLINLGNTCYMNSALQCLLHVPEVNYYFFFNLFEKELNKSNPLGYGGNMAAAFGSLLHELFNTTSAHQSSLSPREFKYTIGHYSSMFQGYQQQDSQEFLSWLLDALHEDLNRIHDKPYLEKPELGDDEINDDAAIQELAETCWNQYKQRNDSAIIDLFSGLYQSTLVCPDCSKTSITFDPFNDLTLPLPINTKWYHRFKIINLDFSLPLKERVKLLEVELSKTSTLSDLVAYLGNFLKVPTEFLFMFEIFNNFFYRDFQANNTKFKFYPISELINANDEVLVYIIPHNPDTDYIVPVFNTIPDSDKSYNITNVFGFPLFMTIDKSDIRSFGKIRGKLQQLVQILTRVDLTGHIQTLRKLLPKKFRDVSDFPDLKKELDLQQQQQESQSIISEDDLQADSIEEGYNSDVSLADPDVSASYGFVIKHYEDNRYAKKEKGLNIPFSKPNFNNLPRLSDKLPDLKRNFYHYPEYVRNKRIKSTENNSNKEDEDFVVVDKESGVDDEPEVVSSPEGDGSESENGSVAGEKDDGEGDDSDDLYEDDTAMKIGSLFDSVSTLPKDATKEIPSPEPKEKHPLFISSSSVLVCEWENGVYDQIFNEENTTWNNLSEIANPELEASKKELMKRQKATVSLYDCLENFNKPEILGDQDLWYCPRCKDHKQATKTIEIWSTGDILTIHLKRFQVARSFSDKIDMTVEFPIEGLDMTNYTKRKSNDSLVYDLIAVDNHYGGLGGGHYTASVKNFRDGKWYYYNDGRVTAIENAEETITGAAYLLFYRKRTDQEFLGGEHFTEMIEQGRIDYEDNLNRYRENLSTVDQQVRIWTQHEIANEEETGVVTPNVKKSRSPMDEDNVDKKKRLLSKDKEAAEGSSSSSD